MRALLHRLGVYIGVSNETAAERAEREAVEAREATRSLSWLAGDSCLRGLIAGVLVALISSFLDGELLSIAGIEKGAFFAGVLAAIMLVVRLPGRRRGVEPE